MKDQRQLLIKHLKQAHPAIVLVGTDVCALPALKAYREAAKTSGCTIEFLQDLDLVIKEFEAFSKDEGKKIMKIPD
jgi:hypothetical protein